MMIFIFIRCDVFLRGFNVDSIEFANSKIVRLASIVLSLIFIGMSFSMPILMLLMYLTSST